MSGDAWQSIGICHDNSESNNKMHEKELVVAQNVCFVSAEEETDMLVHNRDLLYYHLLKTNM